jgi:cephalosporin hydroxylase
MQEVLNKVKPDLVIETGIAHGGSVIFTASILKMIGKKNFKVIGIDIDIRKHNLKEIKKSIYFKYLDLIEGSSIDEKIFKLVKKKIKKNKKVLVILDSDHSFKHVIKELHLYSKLVSKNSYIILPDTYIDFMPKNTFKKWKVGDNTFTALQKFIKNNSSFKIDTEINKKSLISEAIQGYVKRIK